MHKESAQYRISNLKDIINVIIPHFNKYPLQNAKSIDFNLWKACVVLVENKEHRNEEGLNQIIRLKSAQNKGLSDRLKQAFSTVSILARPSYTGTISGLNPHWVSGFVDGDGSFTVSIESKSGYVNIRFKIGLHDREIPLVEKILEFFGGLGNIHKSSDRQVVYYTIGNIKDLNTKVISHFDTYKLEGYKYNNYLIWREIFIQVKNKAHLTKEGFNQIEELRFKLNKYSCSATQVDSETSLNIKKLTTVNSSIQKRTFSTKREVKPSILTKSTFNSYLAGLFEGDGHIWIQKQIGSKPHNPRFCITFDLKNEALAKKIIDIIGSGFIRYKTKDNACVLVVSPVVGLKKIVNLINGELRTPKIHQLHSLIDWLNKNHSTQLEKLPLNKGSLDNNSWFSGFVDADGSFSVQYTNTDSGAKKRKISCRLRIEQRMLDPITSASYFDILNLICLFLNCNLLTRTRKSTNNTYYTLAASSKVSLSIIINYFNKFPLYTSKYLDYKDWEQVAHLIINNKHLTVEGINTVEFVRSRMNTKRTEFNWDHLITLKD